MKYITIDLIEYKSLKLDGTTGHPVTGVIIKIDSDKPEEAYLAKGVIFNIDTILCNDKSRILFHCINKYPEILGIMNRAGFWILNGEKIYIKESS